MGLIRLFFCMLFAGVAAYLVGSFISTDALGLSQRHANTLTGGILSLLLMLVLLFDALIETIRESNR